MLNNTLSERVFEKIKDKILSGGSKPGDRLLYEKIAEELKVSLTPVKEALLRLEREGLVRTIPRKGAYVTQLTGRDIMEYTQIRFALESLAVELLCKKGLASDELGQLRAINGELETATREGNANKCMQKDIEFHHALVELSGNQRLSEIINQMPLSNFFALMGTQDIMLERGARILVVHEAIIESLAACDSQRTQTLLRENILKPQLEALHKTAAAAPAAG